MTLRLILIRHAKSVRGAGLSDHERPLADRGVRACEDLGKWLDANGMTPDEVLCSDAARTRETWDRIAAHLRDPPKPRLESRLYEAEAEDILAVLHGATGKTVALVGHNPGIGDLASQILDSPPDHPKFHSFPTGATLVARFDTDDWRGVLMGTGVAEAFVVPRGLD